MQVALHVPSLAAQQLSADKHSAELAVVDLLKQAKAMTQEKIDLCEQRYQQKDKILQSVGSPSTDCLTRQNSAQGSALSVEEIVKGNEVQLEACKELVLAFRATRDARAQLEKCLDKEQALMQQLHDPLQQAINNSKQLISTAAERLQNSDPARDKRHSEMLIRCWTNACVQQAILSSLVLDSNPLTVCPCAPQVKLVTHACLPLQSSHLQHNMSNVVSLWTAETLTNSLARHNRCTSSRSMHKPLLQRLQSSKKCRGS